MNDQNLILNRWRKEQKVFDTNLSVLRKQTKSLAIHDIRVAIKKLRACLKLYTLLKKEPEWKRLLNKTEELFDTLGRQQDIEVCMALTSQYEKEGNCSYNELTQHFKLLLRRAKGWTRQSIDKYNNKELLKISSVLKEDKRLKDEKDLVQNIQEIVNAYFLEIKEYFKRPHKVRQKLKSVYYWISTLPEDNSKATPDAGKLHDISDELGEWQNNKMLLTRIMHFRKEYLPKSFEEALSIKMIEEILKEKIEEVRKSALSKVRRVLKKASAAKNE